MGYSALKASYPARFLLNLVRTLSEQRIRQQYHGWVQAHMPRQMARTSRMGANITSDVARTFATRHGPARPGHLSRHKCLNGWPGRAGP